MERQEIIDTWNIEQVKERLQQAYDNNSEVELLNILRDNSFLFFELYSRKFGIQPVFREISFGGQMRCDFAWLNDNSDGPEWVLLEVEPPRMKLFVASKDPSKSLNHTIEQVRSWRRYFEENSAEKKRIFGAVTRFRYIIVAGSGNEWATTDAAKWRADYNREESFEIRSSDVFLRAVRILEERPEDLWSFAEYPRCLPPSELEAYWQAYDYISHWRQMLN